VGGFFVIGETDTGGVTGLIVDVELFDDAGVCWLTDGVGVAGFLVELELAGFVVDVVAAGQFGEPATQVCGVVSEFLLPAEGLIAGLPLEGTVVTTSVRPAAGAPPRPSI